MNKKPYILHIFKSHYCKTIFILSLIAGYFLVPEKVFYRWYTLLAIIFIIVFALTITCLIRNIKERFKDAKSQGKSLVGIISMVLGISALQVCGVGAPICGATVGAGIVSLIFPSFALGFLEKYSLWIIVFSIIFQLISLYFMKCYQKINCSPYKLTK